MTTATSGQSSRISGKLRPRLRSGHRNVARPAASSAGNTRFTARRAVGSLTPKKYPSTSPTGYCRSQTIVDSSESR
ncbi:MAG TPA: hypothetical protein VMV80_08210 [Anaerolineales bacterium]|nr:hypothetical protein [Anaerolineales bacterium]